MLIYDQQGAIALGREKSTLAEKLAMAKQSLDRLDDETIRQITGLSLDDS